MIFRTAMAYFSVQFNPRPTRRHNKIGSVERKQAVVRALCLRLKQDAKVSNLEQAVKLSNITVAKVVLRSTFLRNILYGRKAVSSFEMARGYTPKIFGLRKCPVSESLLKAH